MNAIASLYNNINMIADDSELLALYNLTNAWINPKIEQDRHFNQIDTLKDYNNTVINRVSNPDVKQTLISKGMYGTNACEHDLSIKRKKDDSEVINYIRKIGRASCRERV